PIGGRAGPIVVVNLQRLPGKLAVLSRPTWRLSRIFDAIPTTSHRGVGRAAARMLLACSDSHKSTEISYMKKTLLAAALLAGFATAGVAQAETSVTLYGILDTGYGYSQFKYDRADISQKVTNSGLRSGTFNGNRWGLKGSEDLGDGLRAIFQLEAGFDIGNGLNNGGFTVDDDGKGTDYVFHRQAFVGL